MDLLRKTKRVCNNGLQVMKSCIGSVTSGFPKVLFFRDKTYFYVREYRYIYLFLLTTEYTVRNV